MDGVLERLHALLVDAVRTRRGRDVATAPVTVAEIYQELAPYRDVRAMLGVEMNADYEHALLRLLAGESELARLEPPTARQQIREELESANPNVTLYRKYAACDVWLAPARTPPDWLAEHLAGDDPAREWSAPEGEGEPLPGWLVSDDDVELPLLEDASPEPAPTAAATSPPASRPTPDVMDPSASSPAAVEPARATAEHRCAFCDSALPQARAVRYCPYCGGDQTMHPCTSCGEALEANWAFCVACGCPAEGTG